LLDKRGRRLKFDSKQGVAKHFQFDPDVPLLITGVDKDAAIEPIWSAGAELGKQIAPICPALVTVPNYSTRVDVPRWDDLVNIKRIATTWAELALHGIPASLHLNARTDFDWERWTEFLTARPEIGSVAFEFTTISIVRRASWHLRKLLDLARSARRPLQIVVRGRRQFLPALAHRFESVVYLDTTSFLKTASRRLLDWEPGRPCRWPKCPTLHGEPLDGLLTANVTGYAEMILHYLDQSHY
jgi:hypothetical protein